MTMEPLEPLEPLARTLLDAAQALRGGELTSLELVEHCLAVSARLDGDFGVFVTRFDDEARAAAERADRELARGVDRGPLQGIPLGIKDLLATREGPTTAHSRSMPSGWGNGRDSTVAQRVRDSGAVILGKTTTMEYAVGFPELDGPFPVPRNPWDRDRWAGGSSSGSASGVAAGLIFGAIGTDTGGSIRFPAAFCGVSGLKPTFGLVPRTGCFPTAFSVDHVGPMARSARDLAALLSCLRGYDAADPMSVRAPSVDYLAQLVAAPGTLSGLRIGSLDADLIAAAEPSAATAFGNALDVLGELGAEIVPTSLPMQPELAAAAFATVSAETLAVHQSALRERWDDYGAHTRELISLGVLVAGSDYVQAQRVRRAGLRHILLHWEHERLDAVVSPTALGPAPTFDSVATLGVIAGAYAGVNPGPWSLLGLPTLALPVGFGNDGLPLSLQIVARPFDDELTLRVADAFQHATTWHRYAPAHHTAEIQT